VASKALSDELNKLNEVRGLIFRLTSYPRASGCFGDESAVGDRLDLNRVLDHAGEAVTDALGGAAVEAEDELVEIGRQVLVWETAPWWVPSSQRLARPNTKWIAGSRNAASPQLELRLSGSWA
jgi:hypothetical protein